MEKVGDDGFKAAPIGAGPYKVVSFKPGVELVLEAFAPASTRRRCSGTAASPATTCRAAYLPVRDSDGVYAYGSLPEIDLYARQTKELDPKKREMLVHQIQQSIREKVTDIPMFEQAFIWGVGPRVEDAGDGKVAGFSYTAPFEDVKLKKQSRMRRRSCRAREDTERGRFERSTGGRHRRHLHRRGGRDGDRAPHEEGPHHAARA